MPLTKRILFGIESFYPIRRAGTETYALNLARELRDAGYLIEFLVPTTAEKAVGYSFDDFWVHQFRVPEQLTASEMNGREVARGTQDAIDRIRNSEADIFHLHSLSRSFSTHHLGAAKKLGLKTVLTPHLAGNVCVRGDLRRYGKVSCDGVVRTGRCLSCYLNMRGMNLAAAYLAGQTLSILSNFGRSQTAVPASFDVVSHRREELKRILDRVDIVVAIAPWIEQLLKKNGVTNCRVVRQAVSDVFTVAPKVCAKSVIRDGWLTIGYVGRCSPIKGLHCLIDAARIFEKKHLQFDIITSEDPSSRGYYQEVKSKAIGIPNLFWRENLPQQDIMAAMMQWDAICVPSATEVAPLVVLEAAACGLPVLGSDIPPITDEVQDGSNGLLFPVGDVPAIVATIERIIRDRSLLHKLKRHTGTVRTFRDLSEEMMTIYSEL